MKNIIVRSLTGALFVVAILGSAIWSKVLFVSIFQLFTIVGLFEYYRFAAKDDKPQQIAGSLLGSFLFLLSALFVLGLIQEKILVFGLIFISLIPIFELFRNHPNPLHNIAITYGGIIYIALPFALLNLMLIMPFGSGLKYPEIVLGLFFFIWMNDTGAYLMGLTFGKHKLFERISPKKTWEGTIGGGLLTIFISFIINNYFYSLERLEWIIMAVIVVIASVLGDLVESMFKRSAGIKDSGNFLPGHGGVLDRFDSSLMAIPFVFIYVFIIS